MKIQDTQAFKKMDAVQQKIATLPKSRTIITDSAKLLKNVGLDKWETLSKSLSERWKNIVKELAAV